MDIKHLVLECKMRLVLGNFSPSNTAVVSEDGGTHKDVETKIQKARGAFSRLRKICLAHYVNKDKKKTVQCICKNRFYYTGAKPGWLRVKFRESFSPL
jgi:hypothetical protein